MVVAVGGGIVYASTRTDTHRVAAPTTSASAAPNPTGGASGGGDKEDDVPPTGCLGGQDRNAAMVLTAQKSAKHTTYGAVEVATSFYRFFWQSPAPSASDVSRVSSDIVSSSAPSAYRHLTETYRQHPNFSDGVIPDGTAFYLSTTNGLWRIGEDSTADRVTVNIAAGYVIDGALSPTKSAANGIVMQWENGGWHVAGGVKPDVTRLTAGGTRYTGGC